MANTNIADLPPHIQRQVREKLEAEEKKRRDSYDVLEEGRRGRELAQRILGVEKPKRKAKYGNTRTEFKSVQGFTVMADSKLEAEMFAKLDATMVVGGIAWWIPHPRFPLPGGVVYVADALAVRWGNSVTVYDAKGRDTQASINKRKQVKALFGIDVELVRK